jgi:beta-1,4-N-acetylglucosaminyltransferase
MKGQLHVLVVLGEGGHSKQCLRLVDLLGSAKYKYSYVLVSDDEVTAPQINVPGTVYRVVRPGNVKSNRLVVLVKLPVCLVQSAIVLLRARPDAVLSTGPGVAVPISLLAKVVHTRVIFVESLSRVSKLSATGSFMRHVADLYLVQWPELLALAPRAIYAGRLF